MINFSHYVEYSRIWTAILLAESKWIELKVNTMWMTWRTEWVPPAVQRTGVILNVSPTLETMANRLATLFNFQLFFISLLHSFHKLRCLTLLLSIASMAIGVVKRNCYWHLSWHGSAVVQGQWLEAKMSFINRLMKTIVCSISRKMVHGHRKETSADVIMLNWAFPHKLLH